MLRILATATLAGLGSALAFIILHVAGVDFGARTPMLIGIAAGTSAVLLAYGTFARRRA